MHWVDSQGYRAIALISAVGRSPALNYFPSWIVLDVTQPRWWSPTAQHGLVGGCVLTSTECPPALPARGKMRTCGGDFWPSPLGMCLSKGIAVGKEIISQSQGSQMGWDIKPKSRKLSYVSLYASHSRPCLLVGFICSIFSPSHSCLSFCLTPPALFSCHLLLFTRIPAPKVKSGILLHRNSQPNQCLPGTTIHLCLLSWTWFVPKYFPNFWGIPFAYM